MYQDHPAFEIFQDGESKIWRYIDFTKFVSMLDKKTLFFCRSDKVSDSFEGSTSQANIPLREKMFKNHGNNLPQLLSQFSELNRNSRLYVNLNCWHINDYESSAMWNLYVKSNEGIAIQTTINKFKESFKNTSDVIYIGEVQYIDYNKDCIPEDNFFYSYLRKRKSFEYEKELRAIYYNPDIIGPDENGVFRYAEINKTGYYVEIDINTLIENIYVSPHAPDWFFDLVESVTEKYQIKKKVVHSDMKRDPIY